MFSHITLGTDDLDKSARFYDAVLGQIGMSQRPIVPDGGPDARCWVRPEAPYPRFYVSHAFNKAPASAGNGTMLAFVAPTRASVDRAYAAGLEHGGTDEGAPGLRPHYAPDYYGAYLRDPSGNKIHLVHRAELTDSFGILP